LSGQNNQLEGANSGGGVEGKKGGGENSTGEGKEKSLTFPLIGKGQRGG